MNPGTIIIILIIVVIVILAVRESLKHMKGQSGCCGGGADADTAEKSAVLDGPVVMKKTIRIEGMHCDNCKNSVTRSLQKLEGVSAAVDLKNNLAVVTATREVSDEELSFAVERLDFKVTGIEKEEV